ncbi:MAG: 3-hydroxybutyryl-CoA dehydrogenase [Actinomycetia bacterium]|nr:3-hydroxybutyryl-CoA dehydrogenase [Actinomycetes bacterium]
MARQFQQVGVVGLGAMGAGIVEVFARAGLAVVAVEVDGEALARGRGRVESSTLRAVTRGRLSAADQQALLDRIAFGVDLAAMAGCELVLEAVPERMGVKRALFAQLDRICGPETVFASNTSSLSVTDIAASTDRPGKVVGMHFFNPAPVMKLVEVVRTVVTDADVVGDVQALAAAVGKTPVTISDQAGFIGNALLFGYLNQAMTMLEAGYATTHDIDLAMRLGGGMPMGPFALLDLIGLDVSQQILETMYRQSRDRRHAPAPILRQMVTAGMLGRKAGQGFYRYAAPGSPEIVADRAEPARPGPSRASAGARAVLRVGVIGSGSLAAGIVEVFTTAGFDVLAVAADARAEGLADRQLVIEAVLDDLAAKRAVFAELDGICAPGAVLATTAGIVPVIECAAATKRAGDVVGLHFSPPVAATRLVEVVSTVSTSPQAARTALATVSRAGMDVVRCDDRAGFIVNALLYPYLNDALKMLQARYASADDIDAAMKLGCGYSAGPIETLDRIGLDQALSVQRALYRQSRELGLAPAPLLEQLVAAGRLGRKTGKGIRDCC